jgi:excisionase family DNA binding protein
MTAMPTPELVDAATVADQLGVTERWLRQQVRARGLPHVDLGRGRMRFTVEQVAALVAAFTRTTTG